MYHTKEKDSNTYIQQLMNASPETEDGITCYEYLRTLDIAGRDEQWQVFFSIIDSITREIALSEEFADLVSESFSLHNIIDECRLRVYNRWLPEYISNGWKVQDIQINVNTVQEKKIVKRSRHSFLNYLRHCFRGYFRSIANHSESSTASWEAEINLSPLLRRILALYRAGWKIEEIADLIGQDTLTVRKKVREIRAALDQCPQPNEYQQQRDSHESSQIMYTQTNTL